MKAETAVKMVLGQMRPVTEVAYRYIEAVADLECFLSDLEDARLPTAEPGDKDDALHNLSVGLDAVQAALVELVETAKEM